MGHVYIINKDGEGKLYISNLSDEIDDYGCIGDNFSLGKDFPPGYWTFGYEQGCGNGYWHHDTEEEPVSIDIIKNIKPDDLIETTIESSRYIDIHTGYIRLENKFVMLYLIRVLFVLQEGNK